MVVSQDGIQGIVFNALILKYKLLLRLQTILPLVNLSVFSHVRPDNEKQITRLGPLR
jgi:hypothetical protein